MNIQFVIRESELKAAATVASDDESCYAMCGVRIELSRGKPPLLIATDGRRLLLIEATPQKILPLGNASFTLPKHLCSGLLGPVKFSQDSILFDYDTKAQSLTAAFVDSPGRSVTLTEKAFITHDFPNWKRLVDSHESGLGGLALSAHLLEGFAQAAQILDRQGFLAFRFKGELSAVEVTHTSALNMWGLLMPARADVPPRPAFVNIAAGKPELASK